MPIGKEWFEFKSEPTLEELISERNLLIKEYEEQLNNLVEKYWRELEDPKVSAKENTSLSNSVMVTFEDNEIKICASNEFNWSIEHKGQFSAVDYLPTLLPKVFWSTSANGFYQYGKHLEKELENVYKERTGELSEDDGWYNYYAEYDLKDEIRDVKELETLKRKVQDLYWKIYDMKEGK